jgi:uncharacterized protein YodC (DUF2158 family)
MEKDKIKRGDTVRLKSGGPIMTVGGAGIGGEYECDWFYGEELRHGNFYPEQLEPVEMEEQGAVSV